MRLRNPSPVQWALIGTAAALTVGLASTAYATKARRRGKPLGPDLPPPRPGPRPPSADPLEWRAVTPGDSGYPWEFAAIQYENYPTPSTWFNAGDRSGSFDPRNGFELFVRAVLGSALAMAGNDVQIATAVGKEPNADLGKQLRRQVRDSITIVGGVNDLLYGQTNLNLAGGNDPEMPDGDPSKGLSGEYVLNEEGRGLNWLPRHANNMARIQQKQPLKRTTDLEGRSLPPPDRGGQQMLIYVPAYDLVALSPEEPMPSIRFLEWSDGSSTIDPPPVIMNLGLDMSGVELPGV